MTHMTTDIGVFAVSVATKIAMQVRFTDFFIDYMNTEGESPILSGLRTSLFVYWTNSIRTHLTKSKLIHLPYFILYSIQCYQTYNADDFDEQTS